MSKVAINSKVLQWALNRSNTTEETLQHKLPKIREWFDGSSMPTLRQVEALSRATSTPLGFLFLDEPPDERLSIPHFRTLKENVPIKPSPDLLESTQMMLQRQAWIREYMIEIGIGTLSFVNSAQKSENLRLVAQRMRDLLNLGEGWAKQNSTWEDALITLRTAMEEAGILVVVNGIVGNNTHRKLDPNEFRGFVLVDEYAPLVFINNSDFKAAQMFTLAHELAHIFYGSSAAFDLRNLQPADDPIETLCNTTAAEFLVPENEIHEIWASVKKKTDLYQVLARQFKVSTIVIARRILDLKLITTKEYFNFYDDYLSDEKRSRGTRPQGGNFYASQNSRIGRRFASAVIRAIRENKLRYSEAYRLTGLYGKTFHRYADSIEQSGALE